MEAAEVLDLVRAHLPAAPAASARRLGAGLDHTAWLVDDDLVVRCPTPAAEARLLAAVAAVSPLPVPEVVFAAGGCLAYRRLPGVPLLHAPAPADGGAAVGAAVAGLAAALRAATPDLAGLVPADDTPPAEWLAEARAAWPRLRAAVPARFHGAVDAFLAAPPPGPARELVFAHNDLGIEHILVDADGRITGILDWSDAALADPARDVALVYRDLGPRALVAADPAVRDRAVFHARCGTLEDLAFGLDQPAPAYAAKALRSLGWLFV
ncbi:phosphotransferase family protein [Spirilliplanes yamanashiensis]|uniref:Aminoglycoside phosphotransferase domain-containing protein n=1 Tax=Spirilliplanes yamanashiensis TaxID=42233 RepID=A0A8J4DHR7_9ACTN|nr:aminoglycoside phosphotransferase family protein [Spirilliplanes yamanashiensis]MDP9814730.1 hypothetical protein [Spirilliplanes yamanashiensis]GIJ02382.1 hypothetical protein Sya03_17340 [Spirilliplanes yamanashiensis]